MRRRILVLASFIVGGLLAGPIATSAAAAADKLKIVATMTILGDMVEQVADGHVALTTLVGPDSDVHVFEPTPADAKALSEADLVMVNGLQLEGWLDRLIEASGYRGPVVVASKGVKQREMEEEGATVPDPHAWQDLRNGHLYVANIAAALAAADPSNAAAYRQAAERYVAEIDALDAKVRQQIAEIPEERRKVVTSHDAFGYFGAAYNVQFVAPEGISEDAEPSAADMKRLIDQIRREHIKLLFFENALSPRLVQQIGNEAGATLGGTLYADALSKPGGPADTYLKMFEHNVPLLRSAMLVQA
jgi:zinc/manganese transport system substrate-binding protein